MATISIITPWLDASELRSIYERTCTGAEVIVIDNGSQAHHANAIKAMVNRLNGRYIRNETNRKFAAANNQGVAVATGDIVLFLNNDVEAPAGWLKQVERDVKPGNLYGPSKQTRDTGPYIEGHCIAATRDTWERLNGWAEDYPGMYWEDNDLCWRASLMGIGLVETHWPVYHYGNYTSKRTNGAYDHSMANYQELVKRIRESAK